jgi:cell wall-associated NlpC family hydrolase
MSPWRGLLTSPFVRAPQDIRGSRSRWLAAAAVALLTVVTLCPGGRVAADPLEDKRREAEQLARELEEQGRQESQLAEELAVARLQADRAAGDANAAEREVRETDRRVLQVRARLTGHAVDAYVRGGEMPVVQLMAGGDVDEMAIRVTYVKQVAWEERSDLEELKVAREELAERRAHLRRVQDSAREALARVEARKRAAAEVTEAQQATLARVQGELATLVAAEQRRREEEEDRRSRALVAARQARDEASLRARVGVGRPGADVDVNASASVGPPASGAAAAVAEARRQIGKPYQWGAAGPDAFDCSGLTMWAWRAGGRSLPHSSRAQYAATARVPLSQIQPGDLVFFGSPIHHMGIYVGDGTMIEASQSGTPVRYRSIYRSDMAGVGRVH